MKWKIHCWISFLAVCFGIVIVVAVEVCRHSNVEKRIIFSVNCSTWQIQRADKPKHEQHNFDFILIFIGYLSQQLKQIYIWKGLVELFKIRLLDGNVSVALRNNVILDTSKSKTSYELISWNSIELMIKKIMYFFYLFLSSYILIPSLFLLFLFSMFAISVVIFARKILTTVFQPVITSCKCSRDVLPQMILYFHIWRTI